MSGLIAIYRREMLSLWVTPLAWVLLVVFLLLQGLSFYSIVLHITNLSEVSIDNGPVQAYFGQSIFLLVSLLLLCPALTMRVSKDWCLHRAYLHTARTSTSRSS